MDFTDRARKASEFVSVLVFGDRTGFLSVGQSAPELDEMWFDLSRRGERDKAARTAALLGLGVRLPIYGEDSSSAPSKAHVIAVRFRDLTKPQLRKLDPCPDVAVAVGDVRWALWGQAEPLEGEQMEERQRELRDDLGGDPDWDASANSFVPVVAGLYTVDGEEVEATEWRIGR